MQAQDKEKSEETAERDFLAELRSQYERDLDIRNVLDSKTNNLITMSGSIITISLAIATFLVSKITSQVFAIIAIAILGLAIMFATKVIWLLVKSYSLRKYRFAMGHESFFDENCYKENVTKQFMDTSKRKFAEHMAKEYLLSIRQNAKVNEDKANYIKSGQTYIVRSIVTVSILVSFVIISVVIGLTNLKF